MNHVIIGTAGHVDHGKTCLIKALTGTDTDRLAEEKKRGITIELGFANLQLPGGISAGIVDVPGHEKFVRNMLAGAGGVDIAMLIVAADEGVMPQTREHLAILSLLDIPQGIIVITKCDTVDEDWVEMVKDDVASAVEGTFLEGAPMQAVSSYTGMGLEELKAKLAEMAEQAKGKDLDRPFRLPADRVFTLGGHGTVITGTLL
ncbi:MAG: selenocysteine-specific translation elongation factor, partial [Clostridia bacterium]|nr:selenocysteine-specific translation elongation factor [Clostridia bacterium]